MLSRKNAGHKRENPYPQWVSTNIQELTENGEYTTLQWGYQTDIFKGFPQPAACLDATASIVCALC